ncbi:hypothetical protein Tco_0763954 [Tanacetum coccineum]
MQRLRGKCQIMREDVMMGGFVTVSSGIKAGHENTSSSSGSYTTQAVDADIWTDKGFLSITLTMCIRKPSHLDLIFSGNQRYCQSFKGKDSEFGYQKGLISHKSGVQGIPILMNSFNSLFDKNSSWPRSSSNDVMFTFSVGIHTMAEENIPAPEPTRWMNRDLTASEIFPSIFHLDVREYSDHDSKTRTSIVNSSSISPITVVSSTKPLSLVSSLSITRKLQQSPTSLPEFHPFINPSAKELQDWRNDVYLYRGNICAAWAQSPSRIKNLIKSSKGDYPLSKGNKVRRIARFTYSIKIEEPWIRKLQSVKDHKRSSDPSKKLKGYSTLTLLEQVDVDIMLGSGRGVLILKNHLLHVDSLEAGRIFVPRQHTSLLYLSDGRIIQKKSTFYGKLCMDNASSMCRRQRRGVFAQLCSSNVEWDSASSLWL